MPRFRHRRRVTLSAPGGPVRVLIVSASMGAGHDGAARALADQLRAAGHTAAVKDFLTSGPFQIGAALRSGYEFELKHVPSAYEATYRLWYRVPWLCPVVAWLVTTLTRRRVLRWVRDTQADVVVSTYPLATLCLGRLRSLGKLQVPAVNFITDFGVHPLWVHRGMDLNLAVHEDSARMAANRTGRPSFACGPVVAPDFEVSRLPDRAAARSRFGIGESARAVLVVAGSWGVGDIETTCRAIAGDSRFTPVVVCGRDRRLAEEVSTFTARTAADAVVLGWTDDMPALMAACDALVENAGGLTSLEAMRAGLPVVSFQPIAGHGKENTARMAEAGVSRLAPTPEDLARVLADLTEPGPGRHLQVERAHSIFRADAAAMVVDRAGQPLVTAPADRHRRWAAVAAKTSAALAAATALGWAGLTSGVAVATEQGAGVAHPGRGAGDVVFVGVRLNAGEVANQQVVDILKGMDVTAVVDDRTALANQAAARNLASEGVNVANGGLGETAGGRAGDDGRLPWKRARSDARAGAQLEQIVQEPVTVTIPGRRLTAWDLVECNAAHTSLVVPNHVLLAQEPPDGVYFHLTPRRIYLINGLSASPAQLVACLVQLRASLAAAGLDARPFADLA